MAVRQYFGDATSQTEVELLEVQTQLLYYADSESLLIKARLAPLRENDRENQVG